ncbi:serine hydrolase domain-containing protein [uncultured Kordia sp.]|uniref:serine hydrolase domain-containing protein n=1 Tax=uncultured Kordia sp. TaxID=507699 RepID=UPI00260FDFE3|nr:serine hydrolase domain-containing protein [uncultured Kordia sp.]
MNKILFFLTVFFNSVICFGQQTNEKKISKLFKTELNKENVYNAFLHVYSSSKNIDIQFAQGTFKDGKIVTAENPFYLASIGKTVTATAIGILKDQERLQFEDKINMHLSKEIMDKLNVFEGVDYSNEITIAQLLQHTSGLPDYFEDTTIDGTPNMINQLFEKPSKTWLPKELIEFSKQKMIPHFQPGKGYYYTDTEYVLLGLIIEKISGLELHEFFKKYIFQPLHMKHTYMHLRSTSIRQTLQMAEMYASRYEISTFKSLSADWAGGGIVSTTQDLLKFHKALLSGKIVQKKTLERMQQWTPETQGMYYGFGLRKVVLNELDQNLPKIELIGHSGSTASFMYYCPNIDTYISGTLNQTDSTKNSLSLITNILTLIHQN